MERFIDVNNLSLTLTLAVQGVVILFWVVSPFVGGIMAKGVKRRPNATLIIGLSLLVFNLLFVGLTYILQKARGDPNLNTAISVSSLAIALAVAMVLARYLNWMMKPAPSLMDEELRYLISRDQTSLAPFEQKRLEQLKKYYKRKS